jgi:hypothetical protein
MHPLQGLVEGSLTVGEQVPVDTERGFDVLVSEPPLELQGVGSLIDEDGGAGMRSSWKVNPERPAASVALAHIRGMKLS